SVRSVMKDAGLFATLLSVPPLAGFVRRLSREFDADDIVYLNSQKALVAGAPAAAMARKPAIWNLHDILTSEHFGSMNRRAAIFVANRFVKRVVVNSMATGSALAEAGFNDRNVDLVYNGIDENRFRPMS